MREKLLSAHRSTEAELTVDAEKLKRILTGAVDDIADLHNEIARKKMLSQHNEKAAEDFRSRMVTKLEVHQWTLKFMHIASVFLHISVFS